MSARSSVLTALASLLTGITPGATVGYVNTPSAVKRVQFFPAEQDLDSSLDTIFLIRVERETHTAGTSCTFEGVLETYILVARKFTEATENPFKEQTPVRCLVVDDLVDDIKEALIRDSHLTQNGVPTAIDALHQGLIIERDFYTSTWAAAEIRLGIRYWYQSPPEGTPR